MVRGVILTIINIKFILLDSFNIVWVISKEGGHIGHGDGSVDQCCPNRGPWACDLQAHFKWPSRAGQIYAIFSNKMKLRDNLQ